MSEWISVEDCLPQDYEMVLVKTNITNHHIGKKIQDIKLVSIRRGISKEERKLLEEKQDPRALEYRSCDEDGNNKKPYHWEEFGPGDYFGQQVTHWMPLPEAPEAK